MVVAVLVLVLVLVLARRMTESTKRGWRKNSRNAAFEMSQRNSARHNDGDKPSEISDVYLFIVQARERVNVNCTDTATVPMCLI